MNESCYTRYPEEEEILLDDGRPFYIERIFKNQTITEVTSEFYGQSLTTIKFKSCLPVGIDTSKIGLMSTQGDL